MRGIVRNVDESRGAELARSADLNTSPNPSLVFRMRVFCSRWDWGWYLL